MQDALKSELEAEAAELSTHRLRGVDLHVQKTAGVKVAIIDFTLSRLDLANGGVAFCNLAADPELFEGPKGDCQVPYLQNRNPRPRYNMPTFRRSLARVPFFAIDFVLQGTFMVCVFGFVYQRFR